MSTIIVFAEDWQRHPSSSQHVMQQLCARHQVIWVNSIGLRCPRLNWQDAQRLGQKAWAWLSAVFTSAVFTKASHSTSSTAKSSKDAQAPLVIVAPLCLPFHQFAVVRTLNRWLLSKQINRQLSNAGLDPQAPLNLWLALPSAVCMLGAWPQANVIYYCGDDFGSLAGVDHPVMLRLEQQLAEHADQIYCASKALMQRFAAHKTLLLTHGVDADLFAQQGPKPAALPTGRPIAGFYGLLASWLDVELLVTVATQCPQWNFVLIGQQQTDVQLLQRLENVYLLDPLPHAELVQYASHFQALLLPFKHCQQIEFCNPLKLREYLALGHPILSIAFAAIEPYSTQVFVCNEANCWVETLIDIAQWQTHQRQAWQQQSRALIANDSWQAKAARVERGLCHDPVGFAKPAVCIAPAIDESKEAL